MEHMDRLNKQLIISEKKFDDYMRKMHNFEDYEHRLKEILFHSIYLLAKNHNMTHDDAMSYVKDDCASLHWYQEESESA